MLTSAPLILLAIGAVHVIVVILQGGAITVKVVLDNSDMFIGMVLIAPALIVSPRWLTTSSVAVNVAL